MNVNLSNMPHDDLSCTFLMLNASNVCSRGEMLLRVVHAFDRAGILYCILHGYEGYPDDINSDVDCLVDPRTAPQQILWVLKRACRLGGAEVLPRRGLCFNLTGLDGDGSRWYLTLDLSRDCGYNNLRFYSADEVLASRRRVGTFWVPAPQIEFCSYLARTLIKGTLDDSRGKKLTCLYNQNASACREELRRFWRSQSYVDICTAAESDIWDNIQNQREQLANDLRSLLIRHHPLPFLASWFENLRERLGRVWNPPGLAIALLGPDGAGKSSLIQALSAKFGPVFCHYRVAGFAPSLRELLGRPPLTHDRPHGLPARSRLVSTLRAMYWVMFAVLGYINTKIALARSTLILYDRHFVDILVDAKRYRYAGPIWLLRFIWSIMPKPNIVLLLDAPADVLQSRKQEVAFDETARQRESYLRLVQTLKNGHVLDAGKPLQQVANEARDLIIRHLIDGRPTG